MANWFTKNFLSGKAFYELFNQAGENLQSMAGLLITVMQIETFDDRTISFNQINKLEKRGDDIVHKIHLLSHQILFPPINKPDIYALASSIDDVADYIHEAVGRLNLYRLEDIYSPMNDMADYLSRACTEIGLLIQGLEIAKDIDSTIDTCKRIKYLESKTDNTYYHALASLFEEEKDAITLLKTREILHSIENAVNKCKQTADIIEAITLKRL